MDLGANEWVDVLAGHLPADPARVVAAALLAFTLSIDDFIITNFVSGHDEHVPDLGLLRPEERAAGPDQRHRLDHLPRRRRVRRLSTIVSARRAPLRPRPTRRGTRTRSQHDHARTRGRRPAPRRPPPSPTDRRARRSGAGSPTSPSTAARARGSSRPTASATSTTASGIGVTNTGHAHPTGRRSGRRPGPQAPPRPAEHRLPRARPAPLRAPPARPAGRGLGRVPLEQRGRGRRGGGQARPDRDRPAGHHRLPRRLPRPDGPDDGPDDGQGRLPRPRSSRFPAPSTTRPTRTATAPPAAARTRSTPAPATGRPSST